MAASGWRWYDYFYWQRIRYRDEGVACPPTVGLAWRDFNRDTTTYLVVPVNLIVAVTRWLWFSVRFYAADRLSENLAKRKARRGA